jgi:hypothetical protein
MAWNDTLSNRYKKVLVLTNNLTELLTSTGRFGEVLRGYPEDVKRVYETDIATVYLNSIEFAETMGARTQPEFVNIVLGLISKGTKTEVHDRIIDNSIFVLSRFDNQSNPEQVPEDGWNLVKGAARNTFITGFNIYPERTKRSLLTTAVINLRHDVRW